MTSSSIHIIASGKCDIALIAELQKRPEFRKATKHMCLAYESLQAALMNLNLQHVPPQRLGYVLESSHGELPVTLEFLNTLATSGVARPTLFQNSLHNSTLGFLTLALKISGPTVTVSQLSCNEDAAMQTAITLLDGKMCDVCIVTNVESALDLFPERQTKDVATTRILCTESARSTYGFFLTEEVPL